MSSVTVNGRGVKTAPPIDPPTNQQRSWGVPCPACGEVGAIRLNVNDLGDDGEVVCGECDHETTIGTIRALVTTWQGVLAWLDAAPAKKGGVA